MVFRKLCSVTKASLCWPAIRVCSAQIEAMAVVATSARASRVVAVARPDCRWHHRAARSQAVTWRAPDRLVGEEPPEVLAHRLGRLVPRLEVLLDRLEHDRLQVTRDPGIDGPGPPRLLGLDLLDQLEAVRRVECRTEREQLVEREPERVDVGPGVPFTPEPLGSHVAEGSQDVTALGQALVFSLGQAEIRDPDHRFGIQQQVRRLDVPVHDAPCVGVGETPGDLPANCARLRKNGR